MTSDALPHSDTQPFAVKDCALIAIATGRKAQNLKEFRAHLLAVESSSIYYHFWGGLLHAGFEEREYGNDFAEWVQRSLHDPCLAERLAVIDPGDFTNLETMRQELVDVVEERLDEIEVLTWAPVDRQFHFIRSQTVVFDTHCSVDHPAELAASLGALSASSIFYHFIDARQRLPHAEDDFRLWLAAWGDRYGELRERLAGVDPYFMSLYELSEQVAAIFDDYFGAGA
jgi:hypothetical protein